MGAGSIVANTLPQMMPVGYDKFGNQLPQSGNLFDIGIMPVSGSTGNPYGGNSRSLAYQSYPSQTTTQYTTNQAYYPTTYYNQPASSTGKGGSTTSPQTTNSQTQQQYDATFNQIPQAFMDYRKSIAPTQEQETKLQNLQTAVKNARSLTTDQQASLLGGLGGYQNQYAVQPNYQLGGFQPYPYSY